MSHDSKEILLEPISSSLQRRRQPPRWLSVLNPIGGTANG